MAHQSLYLKYRPTSFEDVIGQEQVTGPLSDAITSAKIGHAYLFAGSRGLGKTSVARIFAKEINKEHFDENDVYEIDAASSNSVEDIRTLTEGVHTLPFGSTYKVYILDEVHMLSKSAWNAFLKTLEEPPAHAVFILATTELERVPETVQSRCQVFEFKKPTRKILSTFVQKVIGQEEFEKGKHFKIDKEGADLIAGMASGSYRDALSIAQKVISSERWIKEVINPKYERPGEINRVWVEGHTGAPKRETVHSLVAALAEGERGKALVAIEKAAKADVDMKLFLELVIETLRSTLLLRYAPEMRESIKEEVGSDEYAALEGFAQGKGITHDTLLAFLTASDRIRYASIPALPLELAVLELFPE